MYDVDNSASSHKYCVIVACATSVYQVLFLLIEHLGTRLVCYLTCNTYIHLCGYVCILYCFRFTEFYVDEVQHSDDLRLLIERYLEGFTLNISVVNGVIRSVS